MPFINKRKVNGVTYVYIIDHVKDGAKRKQVTLQKLGILGRDISMSQAKIIRDQHNSRPNQLTHISKTFQDVELEFREHYKSQIGHQIKQATFDRYCGDERHLALIMDVRVTDIDFDVMDRFRARLGGSSLGPRSVNMVLMSARKVLKYAVRRKYIQAIPEIQTIKQKKKRIDAHTEEEVALLLKKSSGNERLSRYLRFMLETGLRPEEFMKLEIKHLDKNLCLLDLDENVVKKNTPPRRVPIRKELLNEVLRWHDEYGRICPYNSSDGANTMVTRLCIAIGSHGNPKKLRKTYASMMVRAGANPFPLAELMGTSVEILNDYYVMHQLDKLVEEAIKNPLYEKFDGKMMEERNKRKKENLKI